MGKPADPDISIVIPVYDEKESLEDLVSAILAVMRPLGRSFEILIVDDGSTDGSGTILGRLAGRTPELCPVLLGRHFGQSAAMTAGFDHAAGRVIVTMDGDLQNDPADIPALIDRLESGFDLVCGWRKHRKDPFFSRRVPSTVASWIISRATGIRLHDYGCTLKAFRSEVVEGMHLYSDLHRLVPVLVSMEWGRITELPVAHHPRTRGKSKYGMGRTGRVIIDLLLLLFFQKFATRPLRLFGMGGLALFGTGALLATYLSTLRIFFLQPLADRPLLLLAVLLMITGVVLFGIGLLAELVMRAYYESSGKPIYTVRKERK
ncbi:MAG: glycosyltransferase family 2 protein [Thermodesulfobacteriota bacterium]